MASCRSPEPTSGGIAETPDATSNLQTFRALAVVGSARRGGHSGPGAPSLWAEALGGNCTPIGTTTHLGVDDVMPSN